MLLTRRHILAAGAGLLLPQVGFAKTRSSGMEYKLVLAAWAVLRNWTCCGNDDTESGRWHIHEPGHPWKGIDVPSHLRLTVDSGMGEAGLLIVNLAASAIGDVIGSPSIGVDETLAGRGITTGPSVVLDQVRIGFGRNGAPISPYSSYLKDQYANLWFKFWKQVEDV